MVIYQDLSRKGVIRLVAFHCNDCMSHYSRCLKAVFSGSAQFLKEKKMENLQTLPKAVVPEQILVPFNVGLMPFFSCQDWYDGCIPLGKNPLVQLWEKSLPILVCSLLVKVWARLWIDVHRTFKIPGSCLVHPYKLDSTFRYSGILDFLPTQISLSQSWPMKQVFLSPVVCTLRHDWCVCVGLCVYTSFNFFGSST